MASSVRWRRTPEFSSFQRSSVRIVRRGAFCSLRFEFFRLFYSTFDFPPGSKAMVPFLPHPVHHPDADRDPPVFAGTGLAASPTPPTCSAAVQRYSLGHVYIFPKASLHTCHTMRDANGKPHICLDLSKFPRTDQQISTVSHSLTDTTRTAAWATLLRRLPTTTPMRTRATKRCRSVPFRDVALRARN